MWLFNQSSLSLKNRSKIRSCSARGTPGPDGRLGSERRTRCRHGKGRRHRHGHRLHALRPGRRKHPRHRVLRRDHRSRDARSARDHRPTRRPRLAQGHEGDRRQGEIEIGDYPIQSNGIRSSWLTYSPTNSSTDEYSSFGALNPKNDGTIELKEIKMVDGEIDQFFVKFENIQVAKGGKTPDTLCISGRVKIEFEY